MNNKYYKKLKSIIILLNGISIGIIIALVIRNVIIYNDCKNNLSSVNIDTVSNELVTIINKEPSNLLFVGVMTANKYIHTRARAVYNTWGKNVPGKMLFFTSEMAEASNLPMVYLEGVDDSYPPQKKSFMMLKYMYDNLIDNFEYFMRADDDLFVKTDKIGAFLSSLNSSKPLFIGQAGQGMEREIGHLSLDFKENFCMGGPGMVFSRVALIKLGPHLENCLGNLISSHEDVEIGRCVQTHVGIPCTWSYEMRNIFYHNNSGSYAFTGSLNSREVHEAITLHPLKTHHLMYKLQNYIQTLTIKEKEAEIVKLMREIEHFKNENGLNSYLKDDCRGGIFIEHLGVDPKLKKWLPRNVAENVHWNYINNSLYQLNDDNPKHRVPSAMREGIHDSVREFMSMLNRVSNERGRKIEFKKLLFAYTRLHPTYAAEYIFDLLLTYKRYRGKKMTVPVRRHIYMQVPFGPLHVREATQSLEDEIPPTKLSQLSHRIWKSLGVKNNLKSKRITFIMPLAGRFDTFLRFIYDYETVCLKGYENCRLIVELFRDSFADKYLQDILNILDNLSKTYGAMLEADLIAGKFCRAKALQLAASKCSSDDLLFFVDVDITFNIQALDKIRWHTIQGYQAYYPIVFSEFKPEFKNDTSMDHFRITDENGYWRAFGYGIVSIYKSDLDRAGGFNSSIIGWGGEDIDLFEKVIKVMRTFRAPDPSLVHVYHEVECDPELGQVQYTMCQKTQYNTFASSSTLVKRMLENPKMLEYLNKISQLKS